MINYSEGQKYFDGIKNEDFEDGQFFQFRIYIPVFAGFFDIILYCAL